MSSWSRPTTGVISTSRTTRSVSMPLHISSENFITEKNEARRAVLHFFRLFFYCQELEVARRPDEVAGPTHQEGMAPVIADRRGQRRAPTGSAASSTQRHVRRSTSQLWARAVCI